MTLLEQSLFIYPLVNDIVACGLEDQDAFIEKEAIVSILSGTCSSIVSLY